MTFSKKATGFKVDTGEITNERGYQRDSKDNKYYKDIQVADVKSIITDDFILYVDADSLCFKSASVQDESYIVVEELSTGIEKEFTNKTAFKGAARGDKISQDSYLGRENLKLEAKGKPLLTMADFTITPKKRLKKDGNLENAISYLEEYITAIKFQTGVDNLKFIIGKGKVFRNELPLPQEYKGNRSGLERPILLGDIRDYLFDNHPCEYVNGEGTGIEVDDKISEYAFQGYLNYRKTGRFSTGQAGIDKDQYGTPSLIMNYDKTGIFFKLPQFVIVEASDKGIGTIEMVGKDCKCTGLLQVCYQICTQDAADNYASYLKFPKDMHPKESYSDASFFKEFYPLETPRECVQAIVDRFLEWFPFGLSYTAWEGTIVDCDTLEWINNLFQCVYMKRRVDDPMTFTKLAENFNVDLSKVTGNNKLSAPKPVFVDNKLAEKKVAELKELCDNTLKEVGSYKSLKKDLLVEKITGLVDSLGVLQEQLDSFYEMKQLLKEG